MYTDKAEDFALSFLFVDKPGASIVGDKLKHCQESCAHKLPSLSRSLLSIQNYC